MNNYYTLIYLVRELNANLQGARFLQAVSFRKNMLDMFWQPGLAKEEYAAVKLSLSTAPGRTALFSDPRASVKKTNVASFFEELQGRRIQTIEMADSDRFIYIRFRGDTTHLLLTPFGSAPNAFLVESGRIKDAFKHPDAHISHEAPAPRPPQPRPFGETRGSLKRRIQQSFPLLPRPVLHDIIHHGNLEEKSDEELVAYMQRLCDSLTTRAFPRLLSNGQFTIIGETFLPDPQAESFRSVDDAIRVAFFTEVRENTFAQRYKKLRQRLEKYQAKYSSMLEDVMNADKSLERAARYQQLGDILMAYAHQAPPASDAITLPDLYHNNTPVEIPLEPSLDIAANAQKYYERKKKAERSYKAALDYGEEVEQRLEILREIQQRLGHISTPAGLNELEQTYPGHELFSQTDAAGREVSKPYKVTQLGKYEVWIGKNAKSNDAILRAAHKDDIWLHARSVTGSHVLLRMNKVQTEPDKRLLETAAGWAAWLSKAKGQQLVPVICLRKKFVRKPKNAPAGTTIFDREEVILAEPEAPPAG